MRTGGLSLAILLACVSPALAKTPVIVELYTSQGCGACAGAGDLVDQLEGRKDLLPLIFSVDTWDYLGWPDTFARPEFTDRQRRYAGRWPKEGVYTPQVVVAGRGQAKADETAAVEVLIKRAQAADHGGPRVRLSPGRVRIDGGAAPARPADVWLIRYDPRGQDVDVRRGENAGRTLTYRNVVRELVNLGRWTGRETSFNLPKPGQDGLISVIVIQKPGGGEVLAVAGG